MRSLHSGVAVGSNHLACDAVLTCVT